MKDVLIFEDGHIEKGDFVEGRNIVACLQKSGLVVLYEPELADVCFENMKDRMQVYLEQNRADRLEFERLVQSQLDEKKVVLKRLDEQLKNVRFKKMDGSSRMVDEIISVLASLEEENHKSIYFDGRRGLFAKDRRKFLYEKVRSLLVAHFDLDLEAYDLFFNRMLDFSSSSQGRVDDFISDVRDFLQSVPVESYEVDDCKDVREQIREEKKRVQSDCAKLQKCEYQSSAEFREFKDSFHLFEEFIKKEE